MKILRTPLLLLSVLSSIGCDRGAWTREDSWYTPDFPSGAIYEAEWKPLNEAFVFETAMPHGVEGESMLESVSYLLITEKQASHLVGMEVKVPPGRKPVLVRGVLLNPNGRFTIRVSEDRILVHHGCLGHHALPMKRQCLVLLLEQPPTHVYVTCSMAE